MKAIRSMVGLALVLSAGWAAADLVKYKDWDKSPEFTFLASEAEKKEWKAVQTDEQAEKLVNVFWARRDPELKTPNNEYRDRFQALAGKADESFKLGRKRGALTERGRVLILLGPPKSIARSGRSAQEQQPVTPLGANADVGGEIRYTWHYEKEQLPSWSDEKVLDVEFTIDESSAVERITKGTSQVKKLTTKAAEMVLVHPELKEAPVYKTREQMEAEAKAAADAAAEAAKGPTITAALREGLEKDLAKPAFGGMTAIPVVGNDGQTHVMMQMVLPAAQVASPDGVKVVVLVRTKDGKDALRKEEAAALQKSKSDYFVDRTLPLEPGDYEVAAALVDGAGTVITSSHQTTTVAAIPTEFAMSPLLLASNDFPATSPKADEPFVFAQRKFVARGGNQFEGADALSYIARVYNPPMDPATRKILLKKSVKIRPKTGASIDVPQTSEEVTAPESIDPKRTMILDLGANIVENLGEYFRPGEYTLKLTVTDAASGKTLEASAPFTVTGKEAPPPPPTKAPAKKK